MRTRRFRGWVAAAVFGGVPALAHEPAARLVPVDPNKPIAAPVARSAYPEIPDSDVYPVPVQGYAGQPPAPAGQRRTWAGNAWAGVKELVVGKPTAGEMPTQFPAQYQSLPPQQPPTPRLPPSAPRSPMPAPQPAPQPARPEAPPPGLQQPPVYAGPPAYRWYGWGSTTPGSNQYAPHGLYPKGSANWYSHTGATPGAFPVPVRHPQGSPGVEPPVYAGNPNSYDAAYVVRPPRSEQPQPPPAYNYGPDAMRVARPAMPNHYDSLTSLPAGPSLPNGAPMLVTENRLPDLNWQPVTTPSSPNVTPTQALPRVAPPPSHTEPQWNPAPHYPGTVVPVSGPTARGQQPDDPPDIAALIRSACFSRVNHVRVTETGRGKLTVTFVTTTEQLAREAAGIVSKLPELRPYDVQFEVQLTK